MVWGVGLGLMVLVVGVMVGSGVGGGMLWVVWRVVLVMVGLEGVVVRVALEDGEGAEEDIIKKVRKSFASLPKVPLHKDSLWRDSLQRIFAQ